jgi:hypothetical protein
MLSWRSLIWLTYECNPTALSNRGEEEESEARHDMETKGLDEPTCKEIALRDTFFAA